MTDPIEYGGIHHVQLAMPAGGEDEARRFYADVLGLRELPKPPGLAGGGGCWFASADGRVEVHLGVGPDFRPARKAHPALAVADFDVLRERLARAGAGRRGGRRTRHSALLHRRSVRQSDRAR